MRKPFRIKGRQGWHAEYKFHDGAVQRCSFADEASALQWLQQVKLEDEAEQGPLFGGPSRITLGRFLGEYAARFTIAKLGYKSELDRINHYVCADGLPRLKAVKDEHGRLSLQTEQKASRLAAPFAAHRDARLTLRQETYSWIARLAKKPVSKVTTDDIRVLMTTGTREGWKDSSIQKEVALLKAAFNSAIKEWNWSGFKNPCVGIKLGKSNARFVVVTPAQMERLTQALSECDNAEFWPLVDMAMHTTLRIDSLLTLKWSQMDLEAGIARVWGKGRWFHAKLPPRAVSILENMPRGQSDAVFTMSKNAVNMAWEGVREKAELHGVTFRDLRHVGATAYAKAGLGVHALKELLGHTSTRMAEVYVNLANADIAQALERASSHLNALTPMPPTRHAHGMNKHPRKRMPQAWEEAATGNVFYIRRDQNSLNLVSVEDAAAAAGRAAAVGRTASGG